MSVFIHRVNVVTKSAEDRNQALIAIDVLRTFMLAENMINELSVDVNAKNPNQIKLYEVWESFEAFREFTTKHEKFAEFMATVMPHLESPLVRSGYTSTKVF